jgi:hypothetical protein
MDPMQLMMMQRMMQQRGGQGMFGSTGGSIPALMAQNPQLGQQQPPQGQPAMGTPPAGQPPAAGEPDHHSKLHQMLPYLGMGLLPMLLGGLGGGGMGQMASMLSPLAFGLHKAKVF